MAVETWARIPAATICISFLLSNVNSFYSFNFIKSIFFKLFLKGLFNFCVSLLGFNENLVKKNKFQLVNIIYMNFLPIYYILDQFNILILKFIDWDIFLLCDRCILFYSPEYYIYWLMHLPFTLGHETSKWMSATK